MNYFYSNPNNLVTALSNYLSIFSEGNPPAAVPVVRCSGGEVDVRATLELPVYLDFPKSEKDIWLQEGN